MSDWYIDRSRNISSVFKEGIYNKLIEYIKEYDENETPKRLIDFLGISGKNPNAYLTYLRDIGFITIDNEPTNFLRACSLCNLSESQIITLLLVKRDSQKNEASNVKPFVAISKFLMLQKKLGNSLTLNWNHCAQFLMGIDSYLNINEEDFKSIEFSDELNDNKGVLDIWFNALIDSGLFTGTKREVTLVDEYFNLIKFIAQYGDSLQVNKTRELYMLHCSSGYHGIPQLVFGFPNESIKLLYKYYWLFEFSNMALNFRDNEKIHLSRGRNKIYYGIPGCGKSWHIENIVLKGIDKTNNVFRTTFYLDYSNSDFIGQVYPKVEKDENGKSIVTYRNVPGPFTKALARAYQNPSEMIYLVIEEINRGNAAAIFGDTFQLLDRLKEENENYLAGDSEYPITNEFIESYFKEQGIDISKKIYIPRNLTILATMNTSDQNVFPLDTAFKRRWDKERVVGDWGTCTFATKYIPFTGITWENFADVINSKIINNTENGMTEDKKMGCYFATEDMFTDKPYTKDSDKLTRFVNNVIDYLFNDVSKFDHEVLFNKELKSFDSIDERIKDIKEERKEFTVLFNEQLGFIQVNLEKKEVDDKHE